MGLSSMSRLSGVLCLACTESACGDIGLVGLGVLRYWGLGYSSSLGLTANRGANGAG